MQEEIPSTFGRLYYNIYSHPGQKSKNNKFALYYGSWSDSEDTRVAYSSETVAVVALEKPMFVIHEWTVGNCHYWDDTPDPPTNSLPKVFFGDDDDYVLHFGDKLLHIIPDEKKRWIIPNAPSNPSDLATTVATF